MKHIVVSIVLFFVASFPAASKPVRPAPDANPLTLYPDPDVIPFIHRAFKLPLRVENPKDLAEACLFVSTDRGKSWNYVETVHSVSECFSFKTEDDGVFWFAFQIFNRGDPAPEKIGK